jgi:NADH:ubiquinone oxidoreductase subunit C
MVYHLESLSLNQILVVKAKINDRENPMIDSVCSIWKTAEFHEREAYDLFGVRFNNHPDLRRLFLTEEWVGWPLRKDYEDPINMIKL